MGKKTVSSTYCPGSTGYLQAKEWSWTPTSFRIQKLTKMVQRPKYKSKTISLLEESIVVNFYNLGFGNGWENYFVCTLTAKFSIYKILLSPLRNLNLLKTKLLQNSKYMLSGPMTHTGRCTSPLLCHWNSKTLYKGGSIINPILKGRKKNQDFRAKLVCTELSIYYIMVLEFDSTLLRYLPVCFLIRNLVFT